MEENTKKHFILPLILTSCVLIGILLGSLFSRSESNEIGVNQPEKVKKMQEIINVLNSQYVDSLNGDALFEQTISDMLHKLDPHSNYIPAKELKAMSESIEGHFGGIGVRFFIIRDTVCITNVIPYSPSAQVGLKAGDKIVAVNDKNICNKAISNEKIMGLLKGIENTTVKLTINRRGKQFTKQLTRGIIQIESILAAYMIKPTVGYIKIDEFSMTTAEEFKQHAIRLKKQGMTKLIIDLRNNPGGVLSAASEIADQLLTANLSILKVKGEHTREQEYKATSGGILEDIKLSVLINAQSASASEILAGAIQDNDRGTIVGRRSFGKGLVQQDIPLRDGSNLRLTIARYYMPSGRSIQKPYKEESYDQYIQTQYDRFNNQELYKIDSSYYVDSLKFKTRKGRTVYGSSGISPDYFVPLDTLGSSWYLTNLRYSQAFNGFAFDYLQNKRTTWKSLSEFDQSFTATEDLLTKFVSFASKELKIKFVKADFLQSKELIKKLLKAEIARQIWLETGYFTIMNREDNEVQKALNLLVKK
jgi:carboxyl-terminal processing protease